MLGRLSIQLLAWYLEKLKVIHQCLAVTLVFTSGNIVATHIVVQFTIRFYASVIHSVAHFVNAINFLQHYEAKTSKLNWAKDEKDVSDRRPRINPNRLIILILNRIFCA